MALKKTTRRVQNAQKLVSASSDEPRLARCGIRVSNQGERKKKAGRNNLETQEDLSNLPEAEPVHLSTDRDGPDFLSPESQSSVAAAYCAEHNMLYDAEISLRLADIDVRARKEGSWRNRPNLAKHLEDAKAGLFTDIVFYKLSRLARNVQDGLEIVREFANAGVTVHFVRDPIPPIDSKFGELILVIFLWLAQSESDNIADNVSDTVTQKWREGKPHGHKHGWLLGEKHWESERRLVELALEGRTYVDIARWLNKESRVTARDGHWSNAQVSRKLSLENIEKMQGTAVSTDMGDGSVIRIPGAWKPLITDDEADALRLLHHGVKERTTPRRQYAGGTGGRRSHYRLLLSGLIRCSVCGEPMTAGQGGKPKRGEVLYSTYCCKEGRDGNPLHIKEKVIVVPADNLDEAVLRVIKHESALPPPATLEETRRKARAVKSVKRTVQDVEREMNMLVTERKKLGTLTTALLMQNLEQEMEQLQNEEQPINEEAVALAVEKAGDISLAQRALVRALVRDLTFPHMLPGPRCVYRAVRVTMKNGREYVAPIYRATFSGDRAVVPVNPSTFDAPPSSKAKARANSSS